MKQFRFILILLMLVVTVDFAMASTVATPTFSPPAGTYGPGQRVTINDATAGASIRFTVDGSTPSETAGIFYNGPVPVTQGTTIKAIGYTNGWTDSSIATGAFTITGGGGTYGTFYVSQGGAGAQTGADSANAAPLTWLNTYATFPLPGSKVHLIGMITNPIIFPAGGLPSVGATDIFSNYVHILFDSGASMTSPCWYNVTGFITGNSQGYIDINGQGWGVCQNTNAKTGTTNWSSNGIIGYGNHWLIQNLIVSNLYQRTSVTDWCQTVSGYPGGADCINMKGQDFVLTNDIFNGASTLVNFNADEGLGMNTNYLLLNCQLLNANHFYGVSFSVDNVQASNIVVSGCLFDHADTWDGRVNLPDGHGAGYHMDYGFGQDYQSVHSTNAWWDTYKVFNNVFGANYSADLSVVTNWGYKYDSAGLQYTNVLDINDTIQEGATAVWAVYGGGGPSEFTNQFFFNNVILTKTNEHWANKISWGGYNSLLANNTEYVIGRNGTTPTPACGVDFSISGPSCLFYNNIVDAPVRGIEFVGIVTNVIDTSGTCLSRENILTNFMRNMWSDYNCYVQDGSGNDSFSFGCGNYYASGSVISEPSFTTLTGWQSYNANSCSFAAPGYTLHADPHSTTSAITYQAGTYAPSLSDIVAQGTGTNLTAYANANNLTQLLVAADGTARPGIGLGNWTRGAYNPSGYIPPPPPSLGFQFGPFWWK